MLSFNFLTTRNSFVWQHGGPHMYHNNREVQSHPERWAPSECPRGFPGRMINNRPGPWKRPALYQRRDQVHQHSLPPQHPSSPSEECPTKRRRDSGSDQVKFVGFAYQSIDCLAKHCLHALIKSQPAWQDIYASLFSHLILEQGHYLSLSHHHFITTAATKTTGGHSITEGVQVTALTTGPHQLSNR